MILPDRVFGRSGVNISDLGFAIGLILWATWSRSSSPSASVGSKPRRRITKALIASPVTGSGPPTTAASATAGCDTSADSISVVDSRWPDTFITSSTRPRSQK